jgi:hypothetical protein
MNDRKTLMSTADAIAYFTALTSDAKVSFLAELAHELTILARDTYEVDGIGLTDPGRMRALNEVQHRVLGVLTALLRSDPKHYPDDVLIQILLDHPDDPGLQRQMSNAFSRALSLTRVAV